MEIMGKGLLKPQQAMPYHKCVEDVHTFQDHQCVSELYHTLFFKTKVISFMYLLILSLGWLFNLLPLFQHTHKIYIIVITLKKHM